MNESEEPREPVFALDAHALYWYLGEPNKVSEGARATLRLAAVGGARVVVPAIAVAPD